MHKPQPTQPRMSLAEREKLYDELAALYNGYPDDPEKIAEGRDKIATAYNEGVTLDLLRLKARQAGQHTEFKTKFSNLVASRYWEKEYVKKMTFRRYVPQGPFKGTIPPDE